MSFPANLPSQLEMFTGVLTLDDLLEGRFENDNDDNPIYIGYAMTPNASPEDPVWYLLKVEYQGTGVVRKRLPDDGRGFKYIWTDRATYFS